MPEALDAATAKTFDLNAIDHNFIENPYPTLAALREHDPVHLNPDGSVYLTRHEDVQAVYRDRSPIHAIDRLNCPVIFLQGSDDIEAENDEEECRRKISNVWRTKKGLAGVD